MHVIERLRRACVCAMLVVAFAACQSPNELPTGFADQPIIPPDGGWPTDPMKLFESCGIPRTAFPGVTVRYCNDDSHTYCGYAQGQSCGSPSTSDICIFKSHCEGTPAKACCTLRHELEHTKQFARACYQCGQQFPTAPGFWKECAGCIMSGCKKETNADHASCSYGGGPAGECGYKCWAGDLTCDETPAMSATCTARGVKPACDYVAPTLCDTCKCPVESGETVVESSCGTVETYLCGRETCTVQIPSGSGSGGSGGSGSGSGTTEERNCVSDVCTVECKQSGNQLVFAMTTGCEVGSCPLDGTACFSLGEVKTVACK